MVLGLLGHSTFADFAKIGGLACLSAAYRNGPDMLLTFSTILQQIPFSPFCWSIIKTGLNKSVLLSVCKALSGDSQFNSSSQGISTSKQCRIKFSTFPQLKFSSFNFDGFVSLFSSCICTLQVEDIETNAINLNFWLIICFPLIIQLHK